LENRPSTAFDFICRAVASCFWVGHAPMAPATVCSFVVTIVVWISGGLRNPHYVYFIPVIFIVGVLTAGRAERAYGHDGRQIVIDEVVGQMIAFMAMTPSTATFIGGFFLFRLFDILKPFPAGRSQRLKGGWGVMADDVVAGIYANLVLRAIIAVR
jgi:phosphatidylglycerophosphatase A